MPCGRALASLQEMNKQMRQEIAERQRMESIVRESEEKYRLLVENANEAIFILQNDRSNSPTPRPKRSSPACPWTRRKRI
jgi:hypothetical protein